MLKINKIYKYMFKIDKIKNITYLFSPRAMLGVPLGLWIHQ